MAASALLARIRCATSIPSKSGIIRSSNTLIGMTAEAGLAGEYATYDFHQYNSQTITQEERTGLENTLIKFLKTKTKKELLELALEKELIMGPLLNIAEISDSPHYSDRHYWETIEHPELEDTLTFPGAPVKIEEAPWRTTRRAPLIGEHNEEILMGEMGLSRKNLLLLKSRGII